MGTGPAISILVLTLVHFAAFGLLFWHLAGSEMFSTFRIGADDDGGEGVEPPRDEGPSGDSGGGLPLPDTTPAPVRLREPGRIADGYPRRERRPAHDPVPGPRRAPAERS